MSKNKKAKDMNAGGNEGNDVAKGNDVDDNESNVVADNSGRNVKKGRRGYIPIVNRAISGHIEWENENREVEQKENDKEKTKRTIKETHGKTKETNPIEERKKITAKRGYKTKESNKKNLSFQTTLQKERVSMIQIRRNYEKSKDKIIHNINDEAVDDDEVETEGGVGDVEEVVAISSGGVESQEVEGPEPERKKRKFSKV